MWERWPRVIVLCFVAVAGRVEAADLDDFARCLSRARATYYTAAWCPHCARQNEMFGAALQYVPTVDCTRGCRDEGISSFPTWVFADGSHLRGVASLGALAGRTGCRLGGSGSASSGQEP